VIAGGPLQGKFFNPISYILFFPVAILTEAYSLIQAASFHLSFIWYRLTTKFSAQRRTYVTGKGKSKY
jgi:hypothetical protein